MSELVSVIVPVYNVENYLNACLESIVKQTYRNLEIWLIDDGSTDSCSQICDMWEKRDPRISVIHQRNQGLSAARNAALDMCSGEWITFVDSDDVIADDYVETLLFLAQNNNVMIAQCECCLVNCDKSKEAIFENGVMTSTEFLLSSKYKPMAWGKIYQRTIFRELRYPYGKIHEDIAVTYKAVYEAKRVAYTKRKLYFCNSRPNSINAKNRYYLEKLVILQFIKEQIEYYESNDEFALANKACRDYAYELLTHYNMVKLLLKNKGVAAQIRGEYRSYFYKIKKVEGITFKIRLLLWMCYFIPGLWNGIAKIKIKEYSI